MKLMFLANEEAKYAEAFIFIPGKPFLHDLIPVGKTGAYPSGAPERQNDHSQN